MNKTTITLSIACIALAVVLLSSMVSNQSNKEIISGLKQMHEQKASDAEWACVKKGFEGVVRYDDEEVQCYLSRTGRIDDESFNALVK